MQRSSKMLIAANIFGTLGYISILFQWLWSGLILAYPILVSRPEFLFPKENRAPTEILSISPELTPLSIIVAFAISLVVIVATIAILIRLPRAFGKRAASVTRATTSLVVPKIVGHKKVKKSLRKKLSYRVTIIIKLLAITAPLLVLIFASSINQITQSAIWMTALFCACFTIFYFAIQLLIVKTSKIDTDQVW